MSNLSESNIAAMRAAFAFLEKDPDERRREDYQFFFELLDDEVIYTLEVPRGMPIYGAGFHGISSIRDLLMRSDPEMIGKLGPEMAAPLEYFGRGDRVVVLGAENYKLVRTGREVEGKRFAIVVDFRDGRIVRMHQFADLSHIAAAYADSRT